MNKFEKVDINDIKMNPFELKDKWMLVTAEKDGKVNTMTASWGGFGVMWNKEVVFVVIRPQRYTKEFVDIADSFTLSFFDEKYKKDLAYLGKVSGRNEDKLSQTSLTVANTGDAPYFEEAETVIVAQKLYVQPLGEQYFLEKQLAERWYPESDYHFLYIAEVTQILSKSK